METGDKSNGIEFLFLDRFELAVMVCRHWWLGRRTIKSRRNFGGFPVTGLGFVWYSTCDRAKNIKVLYQNPTFDGAA